MQELQNNLLISLLQRFCSVAPGLKSPHLQTKTEPTKLIYRNLICKRRIISQYHEVRKYLSIHILRVYKTANQSVVKNINIFFYEHVNMQSFYKALVKLL